jgi:2-polyprenyl-3-methyl-5-hydroxy-6-metoxy-1,4-benzoquinol methylase
VSKEKVLHLLWLLIYLRNYTTTKSTVDPNEIEHFRHVADEWWNKNGRLRGLHTFNNVRIPFIQNRLIKIGVLRPYERITTSSQDFSILDVGCGGMGYFYINHL